MDFIFLGKFEGDYAYLVTPDDYSLLPDLIPCDDDDGPAPLESGTEAAPPDSPIAPFQRRICLDCGGALPTFEQAFYRQLALTPNLIPKLFARHRADIAKRCIGEQTERAWEDLVQAGDICVMPDMDLMRFHGSRRARHARILVDGGRRWVWVDGEYRTRISPAIGVRLYDFEETRPADGSRSPMKRVRVSTNMRGSVKFLELNMPIDHDPAHDESEQREIEAILEELRRTRAGVDFTVALANRWRILYNRNQGAMTTRERIRQRRELRRAEFRIQMTIRRRLLG
ncbi:hypothetical protein C8R43DRAFT_960910 [Mycena crocata]|nr:hypothetical protein C8R43DRAFT_960910 [Mycena crocata]